MASTETTKNLGYCPDEVAVIIPALNEELTIGSLVLKLAKYAGHVIVIDDGSTDHTSEVALMAGARVVRLENNQGKAAAVKRGFSELANLDISAVVLMDGDGQHMAEDIPKVLQPIFEDRADMVIGSRLLENGHKIPSYRKFGQKVLNRFTTISLEQRFTDTQSGFRAMNRRGIRNMDFTSNGYGIESEMIMHFSSRNLRIVEVPINVSYDVPRKHKKNSVAMGIGLVNHIITLISLRRPLMFLSFPGLVSGLLGATLGLACISQEFLFGWSWLFQTLLSGFLLMLGVVMAVSGLTLNTMSHMMNQGSKAAALDDGEETVFVRLEDRTPGALNTKGLADRFNR